jgi:glycosyltransferase involved in cell wall biosynthesis
MGKSALKSILYMSQGIPVVATQTPSNRAVMTHGVGGLFADTVDEWRQSLAILKKPEQRKALGEAGHRHAARNFDSAAWAQLLARRIERLLHN